MMAAPLPHDQLEAAITGAVTRELRRRADLLRRKSAPGVTVLDGYRRPTIIVTSESAVSLRIAKSWDVIADDIEATTAPSRRET